MVNADTDLSGIGTGDADADARRQALHEAEIGEVRDSHRRFQRALIVHYWHQWNEGKVTWQQRQEQLHRRGVEDIFSF